MAETQTKIDLQPMTSGITISDDGQITVSDEMEQRFCDWVAEQGWDMDWIKETVLSLEPAELGRMLDQVLIDMYGSLDNVPGYDPQSHT